MVDVEAKKILAGRWADTGDRTDPDDPALTPPLVRTVGFPPSFSLDAGNTPRRRVFNQKYRENDGLAVGVMTEGVLFWDADLDYLLNAVTNSLGGLYRATVANGPATGNATDPQTVGQTVWVAIQGESSAPGQPSQPGAVASNGQLVWTWNCPLDGGSAITHFVFEWRESGGSFTAVSPNPITPRYVLTGLTNGTTYEARVTAVNIEGSSTPSSIGSGVPVASVPSGGVTLALRALTRGVSGEVDLSWIEPDSGGSPITVYTYQWRTSGQSICRLSAGDKDVPWRHRIRLDR